MKTAVLVRLTPQPLWRPSPLNTIPHFPPSKIANPTPPNHAEPDTLVSYIIIEARKGWQAAAVTICDPPKAEDGDKENEKPLENAMWGLKVDETTESNGARGANSWADAWA